MAEVHRGAAFELQERAARLRPVPARRPARPSRGAVRRQDHAPPAGLLSPGSGDSMKLYGFWRSLATYRVRVAMALKGVHAEEISIDLLKGKQHTDEYRAVIPQGVEPALVLDDGGPPLFQSLADICLASPVIGALAYFNCDTSGVPTVMRVYNECMKEKAFADAHPLKHGQH